MASLSPVPAFTLSLPTTPALASFKPPHVAALPAIRFAGEGKMRRGMTVVTGAGPSTSSYVFAFALPLSLLAVTIFTSVRIADKLDRDYLEELIIDQAIREAEEEEEDGDEEDGDEEDGDDSDNISVEEKVQQLSLPRMSPRTRSRPKREA